MKVLVFGVLQADEKKSPYGILRRGIFGQKAGNQP
jgi:hypothetical protein